MFSLRRALAALSVAVLALTLLVSANDADAVRSPVRAGLGYRVAGDDFVGFYLTHDGVKVYCLDPDKAAPATIGLAPVTRYPGTSREVTAELSYALTHWGDATTDAAAAVESQVVNTLVGNRADVRHRASEIPTRLRARVTEHLRLARRFSGPYSVRVRLPKALGVGQSAHGTVTVTTAAGRPVPHIGVLLSPTADATTTDWARTGRHGVAHFTYAVTDVGTVHIGATAVALPATGILTSHPKSGQQHLVAWQHRVTAHASASFERRVNGLTASYSCSTACNGRPTLSLRACAPASRAASRLVYSVGTTTRTVSYQASPKPRCQTVSIVAGDGDRVRADWQYRVTRGWSRPVPAPGAMTVDCPPVPAVSVSMTYSCSRVEVILALAGPTGGPPLVNRTRHRMVLVLSGAIDRRIYAATGHSAVFTATANCATPVTYWVRSGIRRANGRYNYGPLASVTTPSSATP